ncbi:MAG: hypothetical protein ACRDY3_07590 [Acidimicrobiales bacterium]
MPTDLKVLARRQAAVARLSSFGPTPAGGGGSVLPLQVLRQSTAEPAAGRQERPSARPTRRGG